MQLSALLGVLDQDRAQGSCVQTLAEARRLRDCDFYSSSVQFKAAKRFREQKIGDLQASFFDGLCMAGMPEQ